MYKLKIANMTNDNINNFPPNLNSFPLVALCTFLLNLNIMSAFLVNSSVFFNNTSRRTSLSIKNYKV